jgi:hypothetical protein
MSGSRLKHLRLRVVGLGVCEACGRLFARARVLCGVGQCASRGVARVFRIEGLERAACECPDFRTFSSLGRVRVRDESGLRQKRLESVRVLRREERLDLIRVTVFYSCAQAAGSSMAAKDAR